MIVDHIRNRALYYSLGERYQKALDFFAEFTEENPEKANIILDKENVYVKVRPMYTKLICDCKFEAHKQYADIHYVAAGREIIGYSDVKKLTVTSVDEENDVIFFDGTGDLIALEKGYFMIVLPDDAHMPCIGYVSEPLAKLIAKIKI